MHLRRWAYLCSLLALLALGVIATATLWPDHSASADDASAPTAASALQNAYINVLDDVRPSVVEISTSQGLGSGVVYDTKGNIVTNAHVVAGATDFKVTLSDGRTLPATLVGTYEPDDLAVVRVASHKLPAATFADSSKVRAGDIVLAIGNPLGLSSSVTNGIVSATGRTVSEGNGVVLPSTIQTSAAINPGNSGGGLVGLDGRVMGIPTLAATPELGGSAPGIGFAIPSNTVKLIASQLIANRKVTNSDHRVARGHGRNGEHDGWSAGRSGRPRCSCTGKRSRHQRGRRHHGRQRKSDADAERSADGAGRARTGTAGNGERPPPRRG